MSRPITQFSTAAQALGELLQGRVTKVGDTWNVTGNLNLSYTPTTKALPEGLNVEGYLDLRNTQVTVLPKGLRVGGDLYLNGTQVEALPEDLNVGGVVVCRDDQVIRIAPLTNAAQQFVALLLDEPG